MLAFITIKSQKEITQKMSNQATDYISDKRLVPRIYKELLQLNNKMQTIQFKNGERFEYTAHKVM